MELADNDIVTKSIKFSFTDSNGKPHTVELHDSLADYFVFGIIGTGLPKGAVYCLLFSLLTNSKDIAISGNGSDVTIRHRDKRQSYKRHSNKSVY